MNLARSYPIRRLRVASKLLRRSMRNSLGKYYEFGGRLALAGSGAAMAGSILSSHPSDNYPQPGRRSRSSYEMGHPDRRLTDILLGLNVLVFALDNMLRYGNEVIGPLTVAGAKINEAITGGQVWRFFTPALLHADIWHLGMNSLSLNNVGPSVEIYSGKGRFLSVYLASAFTGTLTSYLFSSSLSVGASGAIFGLTGALYVFYARHEHLMGRRAEMAKNSILQVIGMNFVYGLMQPRIDNWGHFGGLVGGAIVAYLLGPNYLITHRKGRKTLEDRPPVSGFEGTGRL